MDKEFSDFVSSVLEKTDIVTLISRYTKTERKGNNYWACCPFHHETQPSFSISQSKQFFHCFGCKESGNALSFLMKIENIEFMDALKTLAESAGMEVPKPKFRTFDNRERVDKEQREQLYRLMREAARHYLQNLSSSRADAFNRYLEERKIPQEMVRKFGIGASLDFNEILDYLRSKGYTYEQMLATGIAESKDGRYYDVFAKRLIFPIIDNMNNVVAFGGRTLEKDVHFAKYRNSAETWLFEKSQVIFGVNLLKKRKSQGMPIKYVIMVEGYMDVVALHKAGFETAVASMGTALTVKQARQLKLYSDLIYISYDGDTAGQKAIMRGLDILRETGITVKVVRLPEGLDPDDVIKRDGAPGYQKLLDDAVSLTEHKLNVIKAQYDLSDPDKKAQFAIEATEVVKALDSAVEQDEYLSVISQWTGYPVDTLRKQARLTAVAKRMQQQDAVQERDMVVRAEYDSAVKFFLSCLVQAREYVYFDKVLTAAMPDAFSARLYDWCRAHSGYKSTDIYNEYGYDNPILNELFDCKELPGDGKQKFTDVENELYCRVLSGEIDKLTQMLKTSSDKQSIILKINELSIEKNKLAKYRS